MRLLHALYAPGSKRAEPEEPAAKAEGKAHTCELLGGIDADYDKTAATPRSVDHDRPGGYVCAHDGDGMAHTRVIPQGVDGEQVRHDLLKDIRSRVCIDCGAHVRAFYAYVYKGCMPLCGVCYSKREAADNTHVKTCEPDKFAGLRMQDVETKEQAQPFIGRSVLLVSKFGAHVNEYTGVIRWYNVQYGASTVGYRPWAITIHSGTYVCSDGARRPIRRRAPGMCGQAINAEADYYVCLQQPAEATTLGVPERTEQITPIPGGHYVGEIVRHKR
jgi:hypothetical protein